MNLRQSSGPTSCGAPGRPPGAWAPAVALLLAAAAGCAAAQTPTLVGRWTLNVGQSDRPGDMIQPSDTGGGKPRQAFSHRGGFGGSGFGGGGFGGHGGRGAGTGPSPIPLSDQERMRIRQTFQLAADAPSILTIADADSTVTFTADTLVPLVVRTNGATQTVHVPGGGGIEIHGSWQGRDFAVVRKVSGGGKETEDYFRSPDGTQLYVVVGFQGAGGRAVLFRRIYDPLPAN